MKEKTIKELLNFGIINIDKPTGPTSFTITRYVANKLGIKKASHLGTLDPAVTGVLPVALERACRLNEYLMHKDKEYVGIMRLHQEVDKKILEGEIRKFIGKITQLPPVRSSVMRAERVREIKSFEIIEIEGKDVVFLTMVQAGTYIRKLVHDIGEKLGGAHMLELRRVSAGIFEEKDSYNLYDFDKAVDKWKKGDEKDLRKMIIPAEEIISQIMPCVQFKGNLKQALTGKPLMRNDVDLPKEEIFAVFLKDRFIEVAKKIKQGNIIARPEFVLN